MSLTKPEYRERIMDTKIANALKIFGAVCIEGAKWCGKTWTALHHANSVFFLSSPENNFQNRMMAQLSPEMVLTGEAPRLLDEWQEAPSLWDAVRFAVDQGTDKGRFLLTGSATPNRKGILHSGTGRIARIRMRPMSLYESGDSEGNVSLQGLFQHTLTSVATAEKTLEQLIEVTLRGGWPGALSVDASLSGELSKAYLRNVLEEDLARFDGVKRDQRKLNLLLRSLARNESTVVSNRALYRDMLEDAGEAISMDTLSDYLNVLEKLFIIEDQPAFDPNLRSSVRVGKSAKRHFVDPSLAVAAMGATKERLLQDLRTFGFLFESLCIRDLRIYAESFDAQLFHYRDDAGREIDAVIELPDGRWGAFEIKLGASQVDEAAKSLLAIKKLMEEDSSAKAPEILCVICGLGQFAYARPDGVLVVPVSALKP